MTRSTKEPGHPDHAHRPHRHDAATHDFSDPVALAARLDGPARDAKEQPARILAALDLRPTMTVADVGAGTGYYTVRLAEAVPEGAVLATDAEPALVRALTERVHAAQLSNVRVLQSDDDSPGLEPTSVDRILLVGVWHHLPDRIPYARSLAAALRKDGRILIVEAHPDAQHRMPPSLRLTPERIVSELEGAGLRASASSITVPGRILLEARHA